MPIRLARNDKIIRQLDGLEDAIGNVHSELGKAHAIGVSGGAADVIRYIEIHGALPPYDEDRKYLSHPWNSVRDLTNVVHTITELLEGNFREIRRADLAIRLAASADSQEGGRGDPP